MKSTTRFFSILFATLFCLTACAGQTDVNDRPEPITLTADSFSAMHLSASDANILNDQAVIRSQNTNPFVDANANTQADLSLKNNPITVAYKETLMDTYGNQINHYQSTDGKIEAKYDKENGKLVQITATKSDFQMPEDLQTEEDYLTFVKEVLKDYGVTDLSSYQYSCKTGLCVFGENYAYGDSKDCFYRDFDPSCEELSYYEFRFDKIIDGYHTSDSIQINISIDSIDTMFIRFDAGKFENVTKIELSESKMLETLDEYVKGVVHTEKYELLSYKVNNQTLTYVDGKLCNMYTVELNLKSVTDPDMQSFYTLETIGIFCE